MAPRRRATPLPPLHVAEASSPLGTEEEVRHAAALHRLWPGAEWPEALRRLGGLVGLVNATDERLLESLPAGAVQALRAGFTLGGLYRQAQDARPRLGTPEAIARHVEAALAHQTLEHFVVLALNPRNVLLHQETVAVGSPDQCPVDPRAVFAPALRARATSVVLAHNHPSADPEPSGADIALTRQLCEAGRVLCIRVLDHVVVARNGYVSLEARGLLRYPR